MIRSLSRYLGVTRLTLGAAALLTPALHAGNTWIGGAAGATQDWNNVTNWGGAYPTGNTTINLGTGNFPIITANSAFTPIDLFVGTAANTGRVDQRAGTAATGNGNWMFVGQGAAGNGTYNLADTSAAGGSLTGFGVGSGNLNVGGNSTTVGRLIVGDGGTSNGTFNMNTTGVLKTEQDGVGLVLGNGGTSTGNFKLDGGTLQMNAAATDIALLVGTNGGDGNFRMSGGTINATGGIWAGDNLVGSQGLIEVTGGIITATTSGVGSHSIGRGTGQGIFNIGGTANVTLTGLTHVGVTGGAGTGTVGTLAVSGGTFKNTGDMRVGSALASAIVASGTGTFNVSAGTATITGLLSMARGNDNTDTITGTTNVSGTGALSVENDLVLGFAGNGNLGKLTISDSGSVTVGTTAKRWLVVSQYDTAKGQLDINGGSLNLVNSTDLRFTTGNGGTNSTNVVNQNGGAVTFYSDAAGTIPGGGVIDLAQSGAATANNTYNLNGGILTVAQVTSTSAAPTRTFNFNGGTLKATGANAAFLNLGTGNARANVRDGGAVIDSNGFDIANATPLLLSNVPGDLLTGGLTKQGAGKLTLGSANTYTGATNVNGGTLQLDGSLTSNIVVGSSATLSGSGTTTGSVTFNAGSTLAASTVFPMLSNGLSFTGATTLVFDGIPVNGTQYTLFQYGAGGVSGLSNLSSTFRTVITNDAPNSQVLGTVTTASITWNSNSGTWANNTGGWAGGFTSYFNGDTVTFNERPAASVVTLGGVLLPAGVTVNNSSNPYTFTGTGSISGAGALTKSGNGALTIETANTYSGGTTLSGGTLNLNNASALGSGLLTITGGTLDNTSGAPVVMTGNFPQSWDANVVFTGTSSLDMGHGAVTVGGFDDTRTVTVNANTLAVGELSATGHSVVKQGAGTLELGSTGAGGGASVVGGSLNIAAGTLQFNRTDTNAVDSGDLTAAGLTGSATLINGAAVERWFFSNPATGSFDFTGTVANGNAGPLGFNKSGAGTQILSGTISYTGQTTLENGTGELIIRSNNIGAGTNAVINSGKLTLANTESLGLASLIRFAGVDLSTLELAADSDGTAYSIAMGTGTSASIISNRATPGAGINHTLTTQTLANGMGGGTLNITSGANVTSGTGRITLTQLGFGAGTVQTTTLNPTTANVTVGDVGKQNNNISQTLGLGGTSTDNHVTGVISNGPALAGANTVSVIKTGTSTWTLSGANTYTGTTTVSGGLLKVEQATFADAAAVNLNAGGVLNLSHGATDTVDRLFIDGVEQVAGTWGSLSSSATHKTALITGSGILLATNGVPVGGYAPWATAFGLNPLTDGAPGVDKDLDGFDNGTEYILGGSPISGSDNAKIYTLAADTAADGDVLNELVMVIAVPVGTPVFPAGSPASAVTFESYGVEVRGSTTLASFLSTVTPVAAVVATLPPAPVQGGITYEYRYFSLGGSNGLTGKGFLQVRVTNPAP